VTKKTAYFKRQRTTPLQKTLEIFSCFRMARLIEIHTHRRSEWK